MGKAIGRLSRRYLFSKHIICGIASGVNYNFTEIYGFFMYADQPKTSMKYAVENAERRSFFCVMTKRLSGETEALNSFKTGTQRR